MANNTHGTAVVLTEDVYEDLELHYPRLRLLEAGFRVTVAGPEAAKSYSSKHGYPVKADVAFSDVSPGDVDILIVPGGYAPDRMRRNEDCVRVVREAWHNGAILGVICHGAWVPISAGILKGRRMTSFHSIRDDVVNAGAEWIDEPCVVDERLVTSRNPGDLPLFMQKIIELAQVPA